MKKFRASDDLSLFSGLPDEIVLQILSKLIDLKTLCLCKLVSTRFNSIVHQVDAVSFAVPFVNHPRFDSNTSNVFKPLIALHYIVFANNTERQYAAPFERESVPCAFDSMMSFRCVKSLCIQIPPSLKCVDNSYLFKWKVKFSNKVDSFVFLSPNSICDTTKGSNVNGFFEEDGELFGKTLRMAFDWLLDVTVRHKMLLGCTINFPLLEKVSITDSCKRGKVSLSGEKIAELRNLLLSPFKTVNHRLNRIEHLRRVSRCYIPLLELPVSGFVMKGVTLFLMERDDLPDHGIDSFVSCDDDGSEDKEEAAYSEAMMEILKKHRGGMEMLH